jgi:hypothetical protein
MKQFKFLTILCAGLTALLATSCKNQDVDFPDFDYTTTYFAYQYPVRTIVLGEDTYDTSLDNLHKCKIYATMGGVYANDKLINIDFVVDNTLCNNLYFSATGPAVQAMPANYYTLGGNKIALDRALLGAVDVQLTDAFFADNNALQNTYVIPLRMTNVINADSILSGVPKIANAPRCNTTLWDIQPKDYVLYCVKFVNQWHANYLRRGVDAITVGTAAATTNVRHQQYVESDAVCSLTTASLTTVKYPVTIVDPIGANVTCTLLLTFDSQGECTVSSTTSGFTASGNGSFVKKGDKNSWGNKDRDALYLDYKIDMTGKSYATKDTLVVRDRGVKLETFTPSYK